MLRTIAVTSALVLAAVLVGTLAYIWFGPRDDRFAQCEGSQVAGGPAAIGGPFTLVAETGETVTEADVIDGLTLIYFGYTFCPDICPFDVARNAEAVEILDGRGFAVDPVFITVDPDRDTPEVLEDFTEYMHPRMLGLTGSDEQIEVAKTAYRAYGAKARGQGTEENYLVDHTTLSYLMAPDLGLVTFFRRDMDPQTMADRIACFAERI